MDFFINLVSRMSLDEGLGSYLGDSKVVKKKVQILMSSQFIVNEDLCCSGENPRQKASSWRNASFSSLCVD